MRNNFFQVSVDHLEVGLNEEDDGNGSRLIGFADPCTSGSFLFFIFFADPCTSGSFLSVLLILAHQVHFLGFADPPCTSGFF